MVDDQQSRPGAIEPRPTGPTGPDEEGVLGTSDFAVGKFYVYHGPNYYLDRGAVVFNLHLDPDGLGVEHYLPAIAARYPEVAAAAPQRVATLFAETLQAIVRLDMELLISGYDISRDGDEFVIAMAYLDADTVEEAAVLTADWLRALTIGEPFDFATPYAVVKKLFDRSVYGGPTAYALIEAGLKRGIPTFYLPVEREMQWGYGRKQLRGRSTVLHRDGIKDTEFTTFKDDVKDFLDQFGFPTPGGTTCADLEEALAEAQRLSYPVVAKPVAGHKGEGVFTNLADAPSLSQAFAAIKAQLEGTDGPDGVIVERFITGNDHRLLTVDGRFAAALERVPAYVDGNGTDSIDVLIAAENTRPERADHARAPLARIIVDDDLVQFISGQNLTLQSVPEAGRRVVLRRVANISAGGVSIDATGRIHPDNIALCEDIARYFAVTCLGIDVLADDIAKSWRQSSFAIIEINAGPGVFMHLVPAMGEPIDVPGMLMAAHFKPGPEASRIPIIAGHNLSKALCERIRAALIGLAPTLNVAALTAEGLHHNGRFLCANPHHDVNVMLALRDPRLDFALFSHDKDAWLDYGSFHQGADLAVLNGPHPVEAYCLRRDVLQDGHLIEVQAEEAVLLQGENRIAAVKLAPGGGTLAAEDGIFHLLEPMLPRLLARYPG
jgi:cyanophycin synthetase